MISRCSRPRKPAAEPEAERDRGLGLVIERGIVEAQLGERLLEVLVLLGVDRVEPREHHRLGLAEAGQRFRLGVRTREHERVADARVGHRLDAGHDVTDLSGLEDGLGLELEAQLADLGDLVGHAVAQELHAIAGLELAVHHAHQTDDAAILVELGIEDERAEVAIRIARRRRDILR
jgi:hypothetical protein